MKELIAAVERTPGEGESWAERQEGHPEAGSGGGSKHASRMPLSDVFEALPHDVAVARLKELKADALRAWSDTF